MMKRVFLFLFSLGSWLLVPCSLLADQTVTVSATTSDISENLDLKTVATLFGQAKDLEQFEQMLNNPDSAFSNLDLNGDGEVDYLRVIETAEQNRHLVVIQAVLAKDIYQDVASIFVEKDAQDQVTVQVVGDEYIYGADYIIEPVYIYRPYIYDWFWGGSWVAWHSPYYWGYWPTWWHPYHCIDPFLYWDHCYWYHYHYPCSFRHAHHHHPHYHGMYAPVRRNDYAQRHPERSFGTRNATREVRNARAFEPARRTAVRQASAIRGTTTQRMATPSRTNTTTQRVVTPSRTTTQRVATPSRTNTTTQRVATPSRTNTTTQRVATPTRTNTTTQRVATPTRTSSSSSTMRSSAPSMPRSTGSISTGGSRSSGSMSSPSRSAGSSPSRSVSGGSRR